jgi:HNH endonuclease
VLLADVTTTIVTITIGVVVVVLILEWLLVKVVLPVIYGAASMRGWQLQRRARKAASTRPAEPVDPSAVVHRPSAPTFERRTIPERVRHEVWRRDQGRCVDCGGRERLEFDHIIPVSRGGSDTARNLELRCESCNRRKAASI